LIDTPVTVGTLFDEALSLAALQVLPGTFITANTLIRYKKLVPTPTVLLVRSEVVRWEGRKCWVKGVMEDGEGKIYAEAECLYIMVRQRKA
jgi:acyl-coenzyme A thioesterase PaaI-like protein